MSTASILRINRNNYSMPKTMVLKYKCISKKMGQYNIRYLKKKQTKKKQRPHIFINNTMLSFSFDGYRSNSRNQSELFSLSIKDHCVTILKGIIKYCLKKYYVHRQKTTMTSHPYHNTTAKMMRSFKHVYN